MSLSGWIGAEKRLAPTVRDSGLVPTVQVFPCKAFKDAEARGPARNRSSNDYGRA